jgi:hypothetical protein
MPLAENERPLRRAWSGGSQGKSGANQAKKGAVKRGKETKSTAKDKGRKS